MCTTVYYTTLLGSVCIVSFGYGQCQGTWLHYLHQRHLAAESKSYVRCRYLKVLTSRQVQLIADTMAELSVLKLGQKLLPFRSYGRSKFFISNCPIVNKILAALGKIVLKKLLTLCKKNYLGIDTIFATMSEPLIPNLHFLVHFSLQVQLCLQFCLQLQLSKQFCLSYSYYK